MIANKGAALLITTTAYPDTLGEEELIRNIFNTHLSLHCLAHIVTLQTSEPFLGGGPGLLPLLALLEIKIKTNSDEDKIKI